MSTELVKIDPKEFGLDVEQVSTIEQAFLPKIQEREALVVIYDQLITSELTPDLCKQAKDVRLKLVKVRTGISDIHKTQKAFFLAAGRFVDAWKNKETLPVEQMEEKLSEIENYYINIENAKKAQLQAERLLEVNKYTEHPANSLGEMETQVYEAYLQGLKVAYDARIEAEKKAEEERLAAIEADRLERERIKAENERLQQEAEQKEKELAEERRKQAEILETERKEAARVQALKDAENAKLQAELKAKQDAEIASEQKRKDEELKAQQEAAKAAKAPRKEKLQRWVSLFEIPIFENDEIASDIASKFDAFKKWALEQVNKI